MLLFIEGVTIYRRCYEGIEDPRCLCTEPGCLDSADVDCSLRPSLFLCDCYEGFTGHRCDTLLDSCTAARRCRHGYCNELDNQEYECMCHPGWTGQCYNILNL